MRAKLIKEYGGAGFSYGGGSSIFPVNRGGQMNRGGFGGAANLGGPNMMYTYEIKALNRNLQPLVMTPPEQETIHDGNDVKGYELNKKDDILHVGVLLRTDKAENGSLNYYVILSPETNTMVKLDPTTVVLVSKTAGVDPTQTREEKEKDKSKVDSPDWGELSGIHNESFYPKLDEDYAEEYEEEQFSGAKILPGDALKELEMYANENSEIKVVRDPQVDGVFALEVTNEGGEPFHLLWTGDGSGQFDEVEFDKFPPTSGDQLYFA